MAACHCLLEISKITHLRWSIYWNLGSNLGNLGKLMSAS